MILLLNFALAQTWAPVGTIWQYDIAAYQLNITGDTCIRTTVQMEITKDTMIQGMPCKIATFSLSHFLYFPFEKVILCEMNNKVYQYQDGSFKLLYDFSVPVDSYWVRGAGDTVWVDWEDTIVVNGVALRRIWIHEDDPVRDALGNPIVEGIGSLKFFLPVTEKRQECLVYDTLGYIGLRCFRTTSGTWGSCIQLRRSEVQTQQIRCYPNPFKEGFYVEVWLPAVTFTLYNSVGKRLYETSLQRGIHYISVPWDASGVYFAVFNNEKSRFSKVLLRNLTE